MIKERHISLHIPDGIYYTGNYTVAVSVGSELIGSLVLVVSL